MLRKLHSNIKQMLYKYCANIVQILCIVQILYKCCANFVHILCKYFQNIVHMMCKCFTKIVQILYKYCANIVQILYKYCANIAQILCKYCFNRGTWLEVKKSENSINHQGREGRTDGGTFCVLSRVASQLKIG